MSEEFNFGQEKNGLICTCGRHCGVGEWSAERRATAYGRMRDKITEYMSKEQKEFLTDWEIYHGRVKYEMRMTGIHEGKYGKKGAKLMEPHFIPNAMDRSAYAA